MNKNFEELQVALSLGDPEKVAALIEAGADIHYQDENGYDALINAAYGQNDARLLEMLTLLIGNGVSLTGMTSYNESAIRVLSRFGRFDAVQLLLQAGANRDDIQMPELIRAVAFGTLAEVETRVREGADLEARDCLERTAWLVATQTGDIAKIQFLRDCGADLEARDDWERTAWLLAIQTGDIAKAEFLRDCGVDTKAVGRCGQPPLFYAIENGHLPMLRWLLEIGLDPNQTDEFGGTALAEAVDYNRVEAVDLLLAAGADVDQAITGGTALNRAETRTMALWLLEAGADPQALSSKGRRAVLGYPADTDAELLNVSAEEFQTFRSRRFGAHNPEVMNNPFWDGMIRFGGNAYLAEVRILGDRDYTARRGPVWCADRFGQSLTFLADGRLVQIAGEHEDGSDPDFCIYNDVFVHAPDGGITIYGYPETVFAPTDFHTATLVDSFIYVIGSLGYRGTRRFGETPVCRLNVRTFQMEPLETTGDTPGWIYKHRAMLSAARQIVVSGGLVATEAAGEEVHSENAGVYALALDTLTWTKQEQRAVIPLK